jgi:hypothetical protein
LPLARATVGHIESDDRGGLDVVRVGLFGHVGDAGRVVLGVVTGELGEGSLYTDSLMVISFGPLQAPLCTYLVDDLAVHLTVHIGVFVLVQKGA